MGVDGTSKILIPFGLKGRRPVMEHVARSRHPKSLELSGLTLKTRPFVGVETRPASGVE